MMETVLGKPATGSSNAEWTQSPEGVRVVKKETDSQEGTKGRGGRQSDWRVLKGEKGGGSSGRRPITSRGHQGDSVSSIALGTHRKSRAFRAKFDIMHQA